MTDIDGVGRLDKVFADGDTLSKTTTRYLIAGVYDGASRFVGPRRRRTPMSQGANNVPPSPRPTPTITADA